MLEQVSGDWRSSAGTQTLPGRLYVTVKTHTQRTKLKEGLGALLESAECNLAFLRLAPVYGLGFHASELFLSADAEHLTIQNNG